MRSMRSTRSRCLQLVPWRNSQKLKVWLEVLVQKSRKVGDTLRGEVNTFYDVKPAKLDSALLKICTKVETPEYSVPTHPTHSATSSPAGRKEKARKRSEEFCGKCPLCSKRHTWTRRDGEQWPSDRYLSCRKFNDMTVAIRARTVEKIKGCPRCTLYSLEPCKREV